ncbi:gluconokinase [Cryobacterium levicorallinum]|nr:gluconokinase [Cryobacterium levicorallinum]
MGVSGSGKSTIARMLAIELHVPFVEADDLHPTENKDRMRQGLPLDDEHRRPWLRTVAEHLQVAAIEQGTAVAACSALKRAHRDVLREVIPSVFFVYLAGRQDEIAERISDRKHEFMPASLLGSQFDALEAPGDDEEHLKVSISPAPAQIVFEIVAHLSSRFGRTPHGALSDSDHAGLRRTV